MKLSTVKNTPSPVSTEDPATNTQPPTLTPTPPDDTPTSSQPVRIPLELSMNDLAGQLNTIRATVEGIERRLEAWQEFLEGVAGQWQGAKAGK